MDNLNDSQKKEIRNFDQLTEDEKLKLFEVEELEGRLETAWNEGCTTTNDKCNSGCNEACPQPQK